MREGMVIAGAIFTIVVGGCSREKDLLDEEARKLCAKDGGIKIYERIGLTPDKFNESGFINFYRRASKDPLGPDYAFESRIDYLRKGNPEMWRNFYRVIRRVDGKVLGESIAYSRRGGDLPGPWQESSFGCPANTGDVALLKEVFVNANLVRGPSASN